MKTKSTLKLDDRQAQQFLADLEHRLPAYVPGWLPADGGAGKALLSIYARYLEALGERLNQAPDKNKLAFLDQLGASLIPAQAARTPLAFQPLPNLRDGRVPAGTRAGAKVKDLPDPLTFETENDIALVQAKLAELVTVWPGRDAYASHTRQMIGRQPFTLFEPLQPVAHELYLMHNVHFALAGQSTVQIEFELSAPSPKPLKVAWEYWDGQVWRGFKDFAPADIPGQSFDGTLGFQRSGSIRLVADCAETKPTKVNGMSGYWLRGRLVEPFPPQPGSDAPQVDRIQVQTVVDHRLPPGSCSAGLLPEAAFAGAQTLDVTKTFQPLGASPQPGSVFYVACEEAFARPGAEVTVCFQRAASAADEADTKGKGFEVDVKKAKQLLQAAIAAASDAKTQLDSILTNKWLDPPGNLFQQDPIVWYSNVKSVVQDALNKIVLVLKSSILDVLVTLALGPGTWNATGVLNQITAIINLFAAATELSSDLLNGQNILLQKINQLKSALQLLNLSNAASIMNVVAAATAVQTAATNYFNTLNNPQVFLKGTVPPCFDPGISDPASWYNDVVAHIAKALAAVNAARGKVNDTITSLNALDAMGPIAAGGLLVPTLTLPELIWEYWNGTSWQPLLGPKPSDPNNLPGPNDGYNLLADGTVSFTAPQSWELREVNSQKMHWMRVRLLEGYFSRMRLVSWTDKDGNVNFVPIIEPRPPMLNVFCIGYIYRSSKDAPQACLSTNDFEWADHTQDVNWRTAAFAPYRPLRDNTPTLYFGFDRPLPADLVSLFLDIEESTGQPNGPPLKWEYWDGDAWLAVAVDDETAGLALPGILAVTWPGTDPLPSATVVQNTDTQFQLKDGREAAQFLPGDRLYLHKDETGELATLTDVSGSQLTVKVPLMQSYTGGTVARAALPRFGTPRSWLRARLEFDGQPLRSRINSLDLNAVWASHVSTIRDELIGSGNAQPRQVHFTRQAPVLPGQEIEVRELEGARAEVELPILKRELFRQRLSEDDIRPDVNRTTGKINAVWVRWQPQPHLLFSGPQDRHYVVERSQGRILFGDGVHGMIPPAGANNLRARIYRSGGGITGNVPAGAVNQILSGVLAQSVGNPRRAEGGAEAETLDAVRRRGPQTLRHYWQAISQNDYEWLARQASPAVAVARALPDTSPDGRQAKGWVKLIIIPQSQDPQPQPTFELRRAVRAYLARRAPATVSQHLYVTGPDYLPVSVAAVVAPKVPAQAGPVLDAVRQALGAFFHPLTGGPDGTGWPFGRDVYLSDVAARLEALPGVDYIQTLMLLLAGTPQGEAVPVPADRIVVAGLMRLSLTGSER